MNPTKPRLMSILNALAYSLNALETSGFGPFSSGFTSGQDNASISQKYQTIITPHGIAFSIWGLIFISQAVFIISTPLSDRLMTHPLVVDGVSFWYVAVCLAQTAWSPAFANEKILLSAVFMGLIFYGLVAIVFRQYTLVTEILEREVISRSDYWLLQFPFEIHFSWITAALVLNLNILAVASGCNAAIQVAMAVVSLVLLSTMSFICLKVAKRPLFTFPSVAAWATFWMSYELGEPKPMIKEIFSIEQIQSMFLLTRGFCAILVASILRGIIAQSAPAGMGMSTNSERISKSYAQKRRRQK